jgi:putative flippase GtrA
VDATDNQVAVDTASSNGEGVWYSRRDSILAAVAGFCIALFTIPIAINLQAGAIPVTVSGMSVRVMLLVWFLSLPLIASAGLFVAAYIARRYYAPIFQIAKYGLVGLLNSFLGASLVNVLIYLTGIEQGDVVTVFFVLTFAVTVTHSYFWNKYWIFLGQSHRRTTSEFTRFFAVTLSVLVCITVLFHVLVNWVHPLWGMHPRVWVNVVLVLLSVATFLGNYIGYNLFVFRSTSRVLGVVEQ